MALLDAMSSGLDGCLVTLHSPPGEGVLEKLTAYATSEGADEGLARRSIAIAVHLLVWMGRNHAGERVIADVTQVTGMTTDGTIKTRGLWRLRAGERWAVPVAAPEGRMAAVYRAAGVSGGYIAAGGEAAARARDLQLVSGDSHGDRLADSDTLAVDNKLAGHHLAAGHSNGHAASASERAR